MPKVVDHNARRAQIADAVQRIIERSGLNSVTVARTAAEAGISPGLVQHYFHSKDEMLLFTISQIRERVQARVQHWIGEGEAAERTIAMVVKSGLLELIPLDALRRTEYTVLLAFSGHATAMPGVGIARRDWLAQVRREIAHAIRNGMLCGEVPESADVGAQAMRLVALVDGLALHAYISPESTSEVDVMAVLQDELDRVFPGECHHYLRRTQAGGGR